MSEIEAEYNLWQLRPTFPPNFFLLGMLVVTKPRRQMILIALPPCSCTWLTLTMHSFVVKLLCKIQLSVSHRELAQFQENSS